RLRHVGFPVSPRDYRGLTASAFSLPWRSADDSQAESYDLSGIEPGEYYFGIVIYDIYGLHSQISNRIVKTIP
ncbi:MAG: hypothetical protein ABW095_00820, partial [Candidatus Thiodiazotropha sp.]